MKKIKFRDIDFAFEFVSSNEIGENTALLDKATGEIHYDSEYGDFDEIPEELYDSDLCLRIPHKKDLDLGQRLIFRFVRDMAPDEYNHIRNIFSRRGAYRRYRGWLEENDLLQQWYDFENAESEAALREWCADNDIELEG